jgi:gluconokinase
MLASANTSSINGHEDGPQSVGNDESWILFVAGPTGSGKSSVAKFLASELQARFLEGDDVRVS